MTTIHCTFCSGVTEHDNPYDRKRHPKENAAWGDAFRAVCLQRELQRTARLGGIALREETPPRNEQREFALLWRPFPRLFRLRANDVIRLNGRLGRVIRVTECAAVVLLNQAAREFQTRFDKRVRIQPSPVLVRISPNTEKEILNRKQRKKRGHLGRRPH